MLRDARHAHEVRVRPASGGPGFRLRHRVIRRTRRNARLHGTGQMVGWIAGLGAVAAVVIMEIVAIR